MHFLGLSLVIVGAALVARVLRAPERIAFTAAGVLLLGLWLSRRISAPVEALVYGAAIVAALAVGLADHYFFNIEFSHMVALFWGAIGLALFVGVLLWISPWLALPVLVAGALILGLGWALQHRLHELSQTTWRAGAQRNATLVESLTGIETIKSQGAEGVVQARWERANVFLARINVRMRGVQSNRDGVGGPARGRACPDGLRHASPSLVHLTPPRTLGEGWTHAGGWRCES